MAWNAPRTWLVTEVLTAALLNAQLRDNLLFLADAPSCRVFNSSAISVADAALVALTFNSERWDNDNMHSLAANTGRITFNTPGLYLVSFSATFEAANNYVVLLWALRVDGTTRIADTQHPPFTTVHNPSLTITTIYRFAAGSYVEAQVFQDNTANVARNVLASPSTSPEFSAIWLAA